MFFNYKQKIYKNNFSGANTPQTVREDLIYGPIWKLFAYGSVSRDECEESSIKQTLKRVFEKKQNKQEENIKTSPNHILNLDNGMNPLSNTENEATDDFNINKDENSPV